MSCTNDSQVHHPTRMAQRLSRSLRKDRTTLGAEGHKDVLATALGHDGWQEWLDAYQRDARFICKGRFEEARNKLTRRLVHAGVLEHVASRASDRTFAFEPNHDPRQTDLLELLADLDAKPTWSR